MHSKQLRRKMKIEIQEDINLALRKLPSGRVAKRRAFKPGESHNVEFLGEDCDLETISFQFESGYCALNVPRRAVAVTSVD